MACSSTAAADPALLFTILFIFFIFFFFSSITLVSAAVIRDHYCAPSSCGNITNIRYPFRLKDDPPNCGNPNYELTCDHHLNRTIIPQLSNNYYITDITYQDYSFASVSVYFEIQLMYAGMEKKYNNIINGSCSHLPTSPHWKLSSSNSTYLINSINWFTLVNCSKEVKNKSIHYNYKYNHNYNYNYNYNYNHNYTYNYNYNYRPVACLSHNNSSFIYLINASTYNYREHAAAVGALVCSCNFLAVYPFKHQIFHDQQPIDIFKVLAKGFTVKGYIGPSKSFQRFSISNVSHCLRDSIRETYQEVTGNSDILFYRIVLILYGAEFQFLDCMGISNDDESMKHYHLVPATRTMLGILLSIAKALIVFAVLGRCIFAPIIIYTFLSHKLYQIMSSVDIVEIFLRNQQTLLPTRYSYTDIIAMTGHFKEKLGQGGFGSVFKGRLPFDRLIAIKMLANSKCNTGEDFINEVATIGMIHHINVVKLIGFCSDGMQRALVYEYMPNGSLDKFIFSSNNNVPYHKFSLDKLIDIAVGVARGLDYLHKGCDMQILHFDIKPHNILLDHNFNPKLSDFGLAKLYPKNNTFVSLSVARGTIGYIAPELISRSFGVVSHKCDVYSFGMLLLEMAGGRRNADPRADNTSQVYYPSWIYDKLIEETIEHDVVQVDTSIMIDEREKKLCMIGLWCIQIRPSDRPSMSNVIEMLEGDVCSLKMPPKPFFSEPTPNIPCTNDGELTAVSEDDDDDDDDDEIN